MGVCPSPKTGNGSGTTGHKIVCEITFRELAPVAKKNVSKIMPMDTEFYEFVASCGWGTNQVKESKNILSFGRANRPDQIRCPARFRTVEPSLGVKSIGSPSNCQIKLQDILDEDQRYPTHLAPYHQKRFAPCRG